MRAACNNVHVLIAHVLTELLLSNRVETQTVLARLALAHKPGRDVCNPRKGFRPIVVFEHSYGVIERTLQKHLDNHVRAVRSPCQGGYLAYTLVNSLLLVTRASSELAMYARIERGEASADTASFFDNINPLPSQNPTLPSKTPPSLRGLPSPPKEPKETCPSLI